MQRPGLQLRASRASASSFRLLKKAAILIPGPGSRAITFPGRVEAFHEFRPLFVVIMNVYIYMCIYIYKYV